MHELIKNGIVFGAGFSLLLGVGYLLRPQRIISTRFVSLISLCTAVLLLYAYFLTAGSSFSPPVLNHLYVPFIYAVGPGTYVLVRGLLEEDFELQWEQYTFLPAIGIAAAFPLLHFFNAQIFAGSPLEYFLGKPAGLPDMLAIAGFSINATYYLLTLWTAASILTPAMLKTEQSSRVLLLTLAGAGTLTGLLLAAYVFRWAEGLLYSAFGASMLSALGYLSVQRSPMVFQELVPAVRRVYKSSRLSGIDLDRLKGDLERLMTEAKMYHDEELTLASLAGFLGIKDYQLSEYLNNHCGMNFSRYVNSFRVEEAAQILSVERKASVLSVAFRVGFNSKANFNLAFKSIKGTSPRDFLRKQLHG